MASGGLEPERAERLLAGYVLEIADLLPTTPPPLAGAAVYRDLRGRLASPDIFATIKTTFTSGLLGALPELRSTICAGPSACADALRASTWGNLLDVAQGRAVPSQADILGMVSTPLLLDDTGEFLERLPAATALLVIGDNAGETVLDRLFLELLPSSVRASYAVRPHPVLNDATLEDAEMAGIPGFAEVIPTGLDAPTVRLGLMSDDFEELFSSADLILAKGQGNLEGLLGTCDPRLFYSFVVKCPVISDLTGLPEGSGVFASSLRLPGWRF
jgi:uncharacterized protein with ATP-grasp and redox domains